MYGCTKVSYRTQTRKTVSNAYKIETPAPHLLSWMLMDPTEKKPIQELK